MFDVKKVIGAVAPMLATALGGPMAGQAVSSIMGALGTSGTKIDDIQQALNDGKLTGDQLVALKAAELDFQQKMTVAGFDDAEKLAALAVQDRADARNREVEIKDTTPRILAYGITAGFFGILAFMLTHEMPPMAHDALLLMLGGLGTAWASVVAYYFGSSAGSDKKTDLLSQAPAIPPKP
jgi:predicted amino acid-binding ACT domain protein